MRAATPPTAPEDGHGLVERALQDVLSHGDAAGGRQTVLAHEVEISQPIPIYRLDFSALQARKGIQAAEQFGWRYVVRTEPDKFGIVDLSGVRGKNVKFSSFSENSISGLFVQALHVAQEEATRSSIKFDIRSLDIPSLYVSAIWMTTQPVAFIPYIAPSAFPSKILSLDDALIEKLTLVAESKIGRRAWPDGP